MFIEIAPIVKNLEHQQVKSLSLFIIQFIYGFFWLIVHTYTR